MQISEVRRSEALYVQYGCGFDAAAGWVNFDASPFVILDRLPVIRRFYRRIWPPFPAEVRYGDIVKRLPLPPQSVRGLFASHVLEHLSLADFRQAVRNSFDLLEPGGTFRLIVPDLRARASRYLDASAAGDPSAAGAFMQSTLLGAERSLPLLKRIVVAGLGLNNHLWMWDEPAIRRELEAVGFTAIRRCALGDSPDQAFSGVEKAGRFVDDGIVEIAIECRRPGSGEGLAADQ